MKIVFRHDTDVPGCPRFLTGEIYEIPDMLAEELIQRGHCIKYQSQSVMKRLEASEEALAEKKGRKKP